MTRFTVGEQAAGQRLDVALGEAVGSRSAAVRLIDAGLVTVERRHKWAYYSLSTDVVQELTAWLS